MRSARWRTFAILAVTGIFTATLHNSCAAQPPWHVTAYLSGQPNLTRSMGRYWRTVKSAADDDYLAVDVQVDGPWMGARWRFGPEQTIYQALGPVDMTDPESLSEFLEWQGEQTGDRRILIIAGHGTGLATLEESRSGVMADGGSGRALNAGSLAAVLNTHSAEFEVVSLDSCHGASLEVAWELRDICRYCVAAPGKLPSSGLPWAKVLGVTSAPTPSDAVRALRARHDGPVGVLRCRFLPQVRSAFRRLVDALEADMEANAPALRLVRSRTASWGYRDEACDALELSQRLAKNAGTPEAAKAASKVAEALEAAIITGDRGGMEIVVGKVGLFFPPGWEKPPEWYERAYGFARETGWARFLEEYQETIEFDPTQASDGTGPGTDISAIIPATDHSLPQSR